MDSKQEIRTHFKTPEGRYKLHTQKTAGLVPFQMRRSTRLTVAELHGGADEGMYMLFNIAECLHIAPFDATEKESLRTLQFYPTAIRDGFPCVHAFSPARDGIDLLVGFANGEVLMLSLRAQLQLPVGSTKPAIAATFNADAAHDGSRASAVLWVPRPGGIAPNQFVVAHASGSVLVYRKSAALGTEGSSGGRLLSHLSSKTSTTNPCSVLQVPGGGINDAAFSPDGSRLAVACRDGALRLLEWPSGAVVGGFQGYYGALLCCCWSPDGRVVASGGEDDLVAMYSVPHRCVLAFGEGHCSWVSRVAFDPWTSLEPAPGQGQQGSGAAGASSSGGDSGLTERLYRLGSVGQDTCLCLWDLVLEEDATGGARGDPSSTGLKRVTSTAHVGSIPTVTSSGNLATLGSMPIDPPTAAASSTSSSGHHHASSSSTQGGGSGSAAMDIGGTSSAAAAVPSLPRQASGALLSLLGGGKHHGNGASSGAAAAAAAAVAVAVPANPIVPSVLHAQMTTIPPVMQHRIHAEPLSDILFTEEAIFTACCSGQIKCWLRPGLEEAAAAAAAAPRHGAGI